ncbi:MAG: diguanylate cyclase [Clostridia bacterium]|nr:diguanylate cyclase [Clostridia bacterium]
MRQLQLEYNEETFEREIKRISQWNKSSMVSAVVFDIYTMFIDPKKAKRITDIIKKYMPNAIYRGCTTNGNILYGKLSEHNTGIICTLFNYPKTKVDIRQYKFNKETLHSISEDLKSYVADNPWVKAIELLVTIRGMSMTKFCEDLSELRDDIQIYGGGALSADLNDDNAYVFSSAGEYSNESVVCLMLGGDDLNITTTHVTGWKPLGRELHVTKANDMVLYELDGKPAYDTYYHLLKIKNDEHFFENTLEFPFFYEHNGLNILRAPTKCNPDGSLLMTADMEENVKARIAYGDPWTILDNVKDVCIELKSFHPEAFHIYSCAARRTFWGYDIFKETHPMQSMAPSSGFYTSGEFIRTGKDVNLHNVTLVIAAMREGDAPVNKDVEYDFENEEITGNVSMITRLANFIEAATEELEKMAVTDGLTGIFNRAEIQRRIDAATEKNTAKTALIMLDADDFKKVNDVYGHNAGDDVLKALARTMCSEIEAASIKADVGRWGGEEFMICVTDCPEEAVKQLAESIRLAFAALDFAEAGHQTVSLGVAYKRPEDTTNALCIRVDRALYAAKHAGKNQVVVEE